MQLIIVITVIRQHNIWVNVDFLNKFDERIIKQSRLHDRRCTGPPEATDGTETNLRNERPSICDRTIAGFMLVVCWSSHIILHLLCVRHLSLGIYECNIVPGTRMRHARDMIHKRTATLRSKPHRNRNLVASLKRVARSGKRQVEIDSHPDERRATTVPIRSDHDDKKRESDYTAYLPRRT